ncbi:restriction endonuclease PLD domain-containing protein [Flavobacterium yafengii]|uniref:restriction endonuclease PLD domain-containing protein n=1 Tax=Flavobacterium yafengii TaxID=3041253 RepID=UPI0024A93A54|nr:restriction endonuclease PLD domain-containing protein [Flavobacterium yafengii]MDI6047408.1 phospholipase D-like domain-containing protein [Flavobacterium yafengii]
MNIINNRTKEDHELNLLNYFKSSDEAIIVSPFLSKSFKFFGFDKIKHVNKITLITTLKNDYNDQLCKINFFKNLFDFGIKESIDIEILIDNSLHGKIYIFKKENEFKNAIITSANFTLNGLKLNNEWGISFDEPKKIEEITRDLISNIVLEPITKTILDNLENKFASNPQPKQVIVKTINLVEILGLKSNPLIIPNKNTIWLKPIGSSEHFIKLNEKYANPTHELYFAKNPRGVKIGDILIAYAVGYKKVLSIFRVASSVLITSNSSDRWHYYLEGENLTRFYGNEWNKHNIHISDQKHFFVKENKLSATPSGKNSYGTLQRGGDKLRITSEFGNYLINKIVAINKDISFNDENI